MSAVITLVIVVMWAVVLVPMWLRRHDRLSELASVDRFAGAMRVLSRRTVGRPDRRYVVMPERPARREVAEFSVKPVRQPAAPRRRSWLRRRARAPRPVASLQVARRRRTLGVLAGLAAVTGGLVAIGGLSLIWFQVAADALLLLGLLRAISLTRADRRRQRNRAVRKRRGAELRARLAELDPALADPVFTPAADPVVEAPAGESAVVVLGEGNPHITLPPPDPVATGPDVAPSRRGRGPDRPGRRTRPGTPPSGGRRARRAPEPVDVAEPAAAEPAEPVEPVEPAEATEAAPPGTPTRVIDLTRTGQPAEGYLFELEPGGEAADGGADVAEAELQAAEMADAELDAIIERRRAVGD